MQIKNKMMGKVAVLAGLLLMQSVLAAPVELRFSWWGGSERHEATQRAIRLFEAQNPGVRIRAEPSAWLSYLNRLRTQIHDKTEPDIIQIDWAWLSLFSRYGDGFYDLNQSRSQLKLDEYPNERYRDGLVFRHLNGLPVSYTARVFFWNKAVYDKAGLPPPKTWDQLLQAGPLFKERLGHDYYPLDSDDLDALFLTYAYIMQKTGKPYIFNNQAKVALSQEEAQEWVRFYKLLFSEHVLAPIAERRTRGGRPPEQQQGWVDGKLGGLYSWNSQLRTRAVVLRAPGRVDVGEFLTMSGARNSGMLGRPTMLLAVSKHAKNPEIATRFISFLLSDPEAVKVLGTTRGMPMTRTGLDTLQKQGMIEAYERKAYEQIKGARIDYPSPYFENPEMLDFLLRVFEDAAEGRIGDKEAARQLVEDGNRLLIKLKN